ncbi:MAG: AbrB/MazE/SpoVT family DNA-binding domain-containing protein [Candidatus Heimdallarchaeota archaeon]
MTKDEEHVIIPFKRKVGKIGDSLHITLPKEIVEALDIKQGDIMEIYVKDYKTIIVKK